MNQEIEQYLRIFCNYHQDNWSDLLPYAEFALNERASEATGLSPFFLMYGYNPEWTVSASPMSNIPALEDRLKALKEAHEDARAKLTITAERMKTAYDRHVREAAQLKVGDNVWLDAKNLKTVQPTKFSPLREGPFPISEVLGKWTYRLTLPHQWKIHDVFHASLLSPYKETEVHGPNYTNPPPDLVDGNEEYEVETILAHRKHRNQNQYLVKWKGYASADNTWEPEAHLMPNSTDTLLRYKLQHNLRLSPSQANLAKDLDITAQP